MFFSQFEKKILVGIKSSFYQIIILVTSFMTPMQILLLFAEQVVTDTWIDMGEQGVENAFDMWVLFNLLFSILTHQEQ